MSQKLIINLVEKNILGILNESSPFTKLQLIRNSGQIDIFNRSTNERCATHVLSIVGREDNSAHSEVLNDGSFQIKKFAVELSAQMIEIFVVVLHQQLEILNRSLK